jgi:hypothetical protein
MSAQGRGIPPLPHDDQIDKCIIDEKGCVGLTKRLKNRLSALEENCRAATSVAARRPHLLDLWHFVVDDDVEVLFQPDLVNSSDICGAFLNEDNTHIEFWKDGQEIKQLKMSVDEEVTLQAYLVTRICDDFPDSNCGPEIRIEADLEFGLDGGSIVDMERQGQHDIKLVGKKGGSTIVLGTADIVLDSVFTSLPVEVEGAALDLVFISSSFFNNIWVELFFPGDAMSDFGDQVVELADNHFDDYRIAVASMAHFPEYVDPANLCGEPAYVSYADRTQPWAPYEAFTPVLSFQASTVPGNVGLAFQSLSYTCQVSPGWWEGVGAHSLYTALLSAIDGSTLDGWSSSTSFGSQGKRAIVFLSSFPACLHDPNPPALAEACEEEAITGLTRTDVIEAALAKDVRIFPIHARHVDRADGTRSLYPNMEDYWTEIAVETGGSVHFPPSPLTLGTLPQVVDQILGELEQ